ncbi:MAG: carboxylesterase family protein [Acidobacteria bacterium]|nr:carboxylesterase family protein [Acidobacteriota bacterium]
MPRLFVSVVVLVLVGFVASMVGSQGRVGGETLSAPVARTDRGQIVGLVQDGVRIYRGVPYAAAPVGLNRWRPPQLVAAWTGVRKATEYCADCPQSPYPVLSVFYSKPRLQSEDCLGLNIWTAAGKRDRLPVMVWIHGGSLTRGSGAGETYDGSNFAKRGVVLVTINYRLGPLGYLAHPALSAESPDRVSGNYGLLDQVAALQWVQRNIAEFGGDPKRVTIFGESAGSWSVNALVASPLAKGLFHRAIGQSGGWFGAGVRLSEAEKGGERFAQAAGTSTIAALRELPAEKIVDLATTHPEGRKFRTIVNVDGWALPAEIRQIFATGQHNRVPVIVGSNANEMTSLVAPNTIPRTREALRSQASRVYGELLPEFESVYRVESDDDAPRAYLDSTRDSVFTWQMRSWARMNVAAGSTAWLYWFSHKPPIPNSSFFGAFHAGEIPYVFNNFSSRMKVDSGDLELATKMMGYWINFAKSADPNGAGLPRWDRYELRAEPYLELAVPQLKSGSRLLKPQLDFIDKVQNRARQSR